MSFAMVFPGQGSQSVGMLAGLAERYPQVQETFAEASEVLGHDLWQLVVNGPEESLASTRNTQPVMLAAGVALWRVWRARGGPTPSVTAGHSLGEYSALVAAGAFTFGDAMTVVADRARFMQDAVPEGQGGIAAVLGLADDALVELCQAVSEELAPKLVSAVNFNAPGQVVIAGHREAVDQALERARAEGAKRAIALPMSVPVHCALMRPAAERLRVSLAKATIAAPAFPVVHNADIASHDGDDDIRGALEAQLFTPVRWSATVEELRSRGAELLIECGPGKVLAGLNKRIDRSMSCVAMHDPDSVNAALTAAGVAA